jgi:hypothetical protein
VEGVPRNGYPYSDRLAADLIARMLGISIWLGRCYFQFGHDCHTVCPDCGRKYRVNKNAQKKAISVEEFE